MALIYVCEGPSLAITLRDVAMHPFAAQCNVDRSSAYPGWHAKFNLLPSTLSD
jgi:hypothetical protein